MTFVLNSYFGLNAILSDILEESFLQELLQVWASNSMMLSVLPLKIALVRLVKNCKGGKDQPKFTLYCIKN